MTYGYIRVSTKAQKINRQYSELKSLGIADKFIYIDKESGENFDRINYQKLFTKLKKDDLLVVKSIDRLGRNYKMILEEWTKITKVKGANIKVLNMPILNTNIEGQNLINKFISDIVLQILSFVAENERLMIKSRQAEGIRLAKERGVKFGRPKIKITKNAQFIFDNFMKRKITSTAASKLIGISRGTFFRILKNYKNTLK